MLQFHAENFCRTSSLIGQLYMDITNGKLPRTQSWSVMGAEILQLEQACKELGLVATIAQIKRVRGQIENTDPDFNLTAFARELIEVQTRLNDELAARLLFSIGADKAQYFTSHEFPQSAAERFPDALFDMDEAAKCFALERPTACVFHLMRVTEYGLHAVGKDLGIKDERPNWEPVILKIDCELKKPYKERQFKGSAEVLAHISAHLNAVKVAWRNRAMHVDRKHTMEEAREIYGATCGLMRYLAENLPKLSGGKFAVIREKLGL